MPPGIPRGAMCVQRFDDSRNSAIHTTYRISLRSSSMREPRDPLLKVLNICVYVFYTLLTVSCNCIFVCVLRAALWAVASPKHQCTQKNVHTCLHCVYVVLCAEPPSQRAPGRAPTAAAQLSAGWRVRSPTVAPPSRLSTRPFIFSLMILPQVHLRKPCYDF